MTQRRPIVCRRCKRVPNHLIPTNAIKLRCRQCTEDVYAGWQTQLAIQTAPLAVNDICCEECFIKVTVKALPRMIKALPPKQRDEFVAWIETEMKRMTSHDGESATIGGDTN